MENMNIGMNWPYLTIQIVNVLLLLMWVALAVVAFWQMRHRRLGDLAHVLWVIVILFVPLLGALAFLITRPGVAERL